MRSSKEDRISVTFCPEHKDADKSENRLDVLLQFHVMTVTPETDTCLFRRICATREREEAPRFRQLLSKTLEDRPPMESVSIFPQPVELPNG